MTQVDGNTTIQGDIKLQYKSDVYLPPPVVYLRMNEGTGTTVGDSSKAGNDLDGELGGSASWSTVFKNGPYAVAFDGDSDYIDMGNDTALAPSTAFSISYWVRATLSQDTPEWFLKTQPDQAHPLSLIPFVQEMAQGELDFLLCRRLTLALELLL